MPQTLSRFEAAALGHVVRRRSFLGVLRVSRSKVLLETRINLKRGPEERLPKVSPGMEKGDFRLTERSTGGQSIVESLIQRAHQTGCRIVTHLPQRADHVMRARAQKCPRKTDQTFSRIRPGAAAVAGRDGHEARVDGMLNDVASIKLKRIVGSACIRQDDCGIEGISAAGNPVCDKVDEGELLRLAGQICARSCFFM